jgi:hypothetical protein
MEVWWTDRGGFKRFGDTFAIAWLYLAVERETMMGVPGRVFHQELDRPSSKVSEGTLSWICVSSYTS